MMRDDRDMWRRRNRTPFESILAGSAFSVIFGVLLITRGPAGEWWWAFPMVFGGALPLVGGLFRLLRSRRMGQSASVEQDAEAEKSILRAAQERHGKLTPTLAALDTRLTIKQAQALLEKMAKDGHAVMNVTRDGIIEFEFPDFIVSSRKELN